MKSSPGAGMGPRLNKPRIIPRAASRFACALLGALLLAAALVGCSATRLAYNQAPGLVYWWFDGQFDLNEAQSLPLREDIDRFFQWHRRNELPRYAQLLQRWQTLARSDITAEQACAAYEEVRERIQAATERSLEPLARLALRLTPEQLQHLQKEQAKANQDYAKDFLRGTPAQRLSRRLDKAVERSETYYGPLIDAQRQALALGMEQSVFDPERSQTERLRRQQDLLQTLGAATVDALRAYSQRLWQSPAPAYRAYSQRLVQQGCARFAALHNSTSAEQRARAVQTLQSYLDDLRALAAQN